MHVCVWIHYTYIHAYIHKQTPTLHTFMPILTITRIQTIFITLGTELKIIMNLRCSHYKVKNNSTKILKIKLYKYIQTYMNRTKLWKFNSLNKLNEHKFLFKLSNWFTPTTKPVEPTCPINLYPRNCEQIHICTYWRRKKKRKRSPNTPKGTLPPIYNLILVYKLRGVTYITNTSLFSFPVLLNI
jgi:hypothetical protein